MTVSYNLDVSSVSSFSFFKLLFRWKGSIWKFVIKELVAWLFGFYAIFCLYRYILTPDQKRLFERIAENCDRELDYIPLTFLLGFFVTIIIDRWRQIFNNMGWIENSAMTVATFLRGTDPEDVLERRSVIRYLVLSQVLVFRNISIKVRRRFPNMESIIKAGFMTWDELEALNGIDIPFNKYWAPIQWAMTICYNKHEKDKMAPALLNNLLQEIKNFRTNLSMLVNYDWVPIPLAYPQVVFLAVRVYFIICLVSRQFILGSEAHNKSVVDLYVPFMTIVQFIFLIGWMKVAEALLNPLGEDDDDFECNFLIDKNIATGLMIVTDCFNSSPQLKPDMFDDPQYKPVYKNYDHGTTGFIKGSTAAIRLSASSGDASVIDSVVEAENEKCSSKLRRLKRKLCYLFKTKESVSPFDMPVNSSFSRSTLDAVGLDTSSRL